MAGHSFARASHKLRGTNMRSITTGKMATALGAAGFVMAGAVTAAQAEVVLTGSALSPTSLYSTGSACTSGCSAGYSGGNAVLTSSDTSQNISDTAILTINNGYMGASLGTLGSLLTAG